MSNIEVKEFLTDVSHSLISPDLSREKEVGHVHSVFLIHIHSELNFCFLKSSNYYLTR